MVTFKEPNVKKIIFISDIHFGLHGNSMEWNNNVSDYFRHFFIPFLKRQSIAGIQYTIIVAGDWFENRETLDINVLNTSMDIMNEITALSSVYMVIGNHDIYKKSDTDINSLRIFERNNKVHIIKDVAFIELYDKVKFLLVSWVGDPKKETEIINKYKKTVDAIVLHSEISGMKYDNGREIMGGINSAAIGDFTLISGHIHTRQVYEKNTDRGIQYNMYIGAPFQSKRSDSGNIRGITVYNINSKDDKTFEFIENDYSPKYMKVRYDRFLNESYPELLDEDMNPDSVYTAIRNNYVDVIITAEQSKTFNPTKFVDSLYEFGPRNITIKIDRSPDDIINSEEQTEYGSDMSITDVFVKHISTMSLTEDERNELEKMNNNYFALAAN